MRSALAALLVAALSVAFTSTPAQAAPTEVNVRIEGKAETLFEGPILTDGRKVQAASDTKAPAGGYRCNGLNNHANPSAGPTPTAASVDAMEILGEDFDGQWYAAPFEDYFIKRWGPDRESTSNFEYWGVAVNNVYTSVGGCQYKLDGGDEVLWIYDAFSGKTRLALYPASYLGGAVPGTATATLNQPFEVEVDSWASAGESSPPSSPARSTTPYVGAEVAPVVTAAKGFQKVDTASPEAVVTDAAGRASIAFTEPGWQRIKATRIVAGKETVIRSNRLDVCVPQPPALGCGPAPADAVVRIPPPVSEEEGEVPGKGQSPAAVPGAGSDPGAGAQASPAPGPAMAEARGVRLQAPRLDLGRVARGRIKVSWRVLDAGSGIERWAVAAKTLGRKGARYRVRADGDTGTAATLRLPLGAAYLLQLTVTDALGRSTTTPVGRVQVPG